MDYANFDGVGRVKQSISKKMSDLSAPLPTGGRHHLEVIRPGPNLDDYAICCASSKMDSGSCGLRETSPRIPT